MSEEGPTLEYSPKEFLRKRRPERFSDTLPSSRRKLDRSLLEHILSTLTSRKQETDFESFSLKLAQKTICPNLRPQTGPTGGGDSKVDSETFPVAEQLSLVWFIGTADTSGRERWAFAFSAKRAWRPKLRSDIAKIRATKRGYSKAFFVSNQFISDKKRSELEDELSKKHKLDVRILDLTWILDRVFTQDLEELAIVELKISISKETVRTTGPIDSQRTQQLDELEKQIAESVEKRRPDFHLANLALEAANIARALERPRPEVEGRYERAIRIAKKIDVGQALLAATYQRAWTAFWWFEDYELFSSQYTDVEQIALKVGNASSLELLHNLWNVLYTTHLLGHFDDEDLQLSQRTLSLTNALRSLEGNSERPSAALQSKTMRLFIELMLTVPKVPDSLFGELRDVIEQSEGLVGYPLEPFLQLILDFGQHFETSAAYDKLFEAAVTVAGRRTGEISQARMLLKHGLGLLEKEKFSEGLSYLGRSLVGLAKEETQPEFISALVACGFCYHQLGLFWAARGSYLNSSSLAVARFGNSGDVSDLKPNCFLHLKWIELLLGRIPQVLQWHEVDFTARSAANLDLEDLKPSEDDVSFDISLGILLLRSKRSQLESLNRLPDTLGSLQLHASQVALLFALGHEAEVLQTLNSESKDSLNDFFMKWFAQPAANDLPAAPELGNDTSITLSTTILGCQFILSSDCTSPCIELAESLLAGLESMLATGYRRQLFAFEPKAHVRVTLDAACQAPVKYSINVESGRIHGFLKCQMFDPHKVLHDCQAKIRDVLREFAIHLACRIYPIGDSGDKLIGLLLEEHSLDRAFHFTGSLVATGNVLGSNPKYRISDWMAPTATEYEILRGDVWYQEISPPPLALVKNPEEDPSTEEIQHNKFRTNSFIRRTLWDKAGWSGVLFLRPEKSSVPPILALVFSDKKMAEEIFRGLTEDVGKDNREDRLKLTIVRGVWSHMPNAYRIVIGTNPKGLRGHFALMNRSHTMTPSSDVNLKGFLHAVSLTKVFYLLPAYARTNKETPEVNFEWPIRMEDLGLRDAHKIGLHDLDCTCIHPDDSPVIPPNVKTPPVEELLTWLRNKEHSDEM